MKETLPPITAHLVDLFQGPLRDVRFPDADAERLAAAVDAAAAARASLARAEAVVEEARALCTEKERAVAHETERTLAYVRIYAAERPELLAALDMVTRPTARRGPGRPRKSKAPIVETEASAAE